MKLEYCVNDSLYFTKIASEQYTFPLTEGHGEEHLLVNKNLEKI